jgi:hypothetical protein
MNNNIIIKQFIFLHMILIILFLSNCSNIINTNDSSVKVLSKTDTVKVGDTFIAKLQVNYNDSILPIVYLVDDKDTFYMPFYENKKYAIIQILGSKLGKEHLNGFVEYINFNGKKIKEQFSLEFTRIPQK